MCDCNKNTCDDCNIRITSSSIRPLVYISGVDDMGCRAWSLASGLTSTGISSVSVASPLVGNGTTGSPLDINFSNLTVTDLSNLASVIPSGTVVNIVGKDSSGNLVTTTLFQTTLNSISGTNVNHPNDYFGTPSAYLGNPARWVTLPDGGKIPVY